ncbi:MAG TPA: hypothetical protein HPP56_03745 [Nitrospirae bacterium]|nr:hypothetical protein [Nitrospirota bacterium]
MSIKAVIEFKYHHEEELDDFIKGCKVYIFKEDKKIELLKKTTLLELDTNKIDGFFINIPISILNFRILKLPELEKRRLREIIPFELEGSILTKQQDLIFDFISEKLDGGGIKALVAFIDKNLISDFLSYLKGRGIVPSALICSQLRDNISSDIEEFAKKIINSTDKDSNMNEIIEELKNPTIRLFDKDISLTGLKVELLRPALKTSVLILTLLVITSVWLGFKLIINLKEQSLIKKDILIGYKLLFPEDQKITDELYQLKSRLKVLKEKKEAIIDIKALDVLKRLSKTQGITLSELIIERENIKMKGDAPNMEELERFKRELTWIKGLTISNVNHSDKGNYAFSASGRIGNEP